MNREYDEDAFEAIETARPLSEREYRDYKAECDKQLDLLVRISATIPLTLRDVWESMPNDGHSFESTMRSHDRRQKLFDAFAEMRSYLALAVLHDLKETAEICRDTELDDADERQEDRIKFWERHGEIVVEDLI